MADARRCFLLLFLLFQMPALIASVPLEPGGGGEREGEGGGAEEEKKEEAAADKEDGSVFISNGVSSTVIKPSESRKSPSGESSLDSLSKTDQTEAKESQKLTTKSKTVEQPVSNSHVQNPELSRDQKSEILQEKTKSPQAASDMSHVKSDPKKHEPMPPAADSNLHTSELDSAAKKPGLNVAEQEEKLPLKPEGPPDVPGPEVKETQNLPLPNGNGKSATAEPKSPSLKEDQNEAVKETQDLPLPNGNSKPAAALPKSPSLKEDQNEEVKETPNLPLPSGNSKPAAALPKSPSLKEDQNEEVKETQNLPLPSGNGKPAAAEPKPPSLKEHQNEAKQNGILTTELKPSQRDETVSEFSPEKSVQNEKLPTNVENNLSDILVPKDEDDEDDGLEEDEMIDDGKVGEEIAGASQSEKEEAKSSPAGPAPKNGSENSHFFAYLVTTAIVVAALYIAYHNKRKIIAFALEGKKSKVIRRPKSSDYQRLDQKI